MHLSLEAILEQYDESNGDPRSTYVEVARPSFLPDNDRLITITVSEFGTWRCVGSVMVSRTMALKRGQGSYIHGGYSVRMLGTPKPSTRPPGTTVDPVADPMLAELVAIKALLQRIADRVAPEDEATC